MGEREREYGSAGVTSCTYRGLLYKHAFVTDTPNPYEMHVLILLYKTTAHVLAFLMQLSAAH